MNRAVHKLGLSCIIFVVCVSFITTLYGFLSDMLAYTTNLRASTLDVHITNVQIGIEEDATMQWINLEEGRFDLTLIQNEVITLRFEILNNAPIDALIDAQVELSFLGTDDISETNILFLYPEAVSSHDIVPQLAQGDDTLALAGFNTPSDHQNTTLEGLRQGFSVPVIHDASIPSHGGRLSVSVKLLMSDSIYDLKTLRPWITQNQLSVGIRVESQTQHPFINWTATDFTSGQLNLDVWLEPTIRINLNGQDELFLNLNEPYQENGATAFNEWDEPLSISIRGEVNTTITGDSEILYCATHGNLMTCISRIVHVNDGEAPLITPLQSVIDRFIEPNMDLGAFVSLSDNRDSPETLRENLVITTPEHYASDVAGTYQVCYDVMDQSYMQAQQVCITLVVYTFSKVELMQNTTIALTTHGKVYAWGRNDMGQVGIGTTSTMVLTPTLITGLSDYTIVDISAGTQFAMALTDTGNVFIWGSDEGEAQGNVGNVHNLSPSLIMGIESVVMIEASHQSGFLLTNPGRVFVWGLGLNYATGYGTQATLVTPTPILFPEARFVRYINHGWYTGMGITSDDGVYGWGYGGYGILMTPNALPTLTYSTPVLINDTLTQAISVPDIQTISLGERHGYLITQQGRVYAWGSDEFGQLGNGVGETSAFIPEPIFVLDQLDDTIISVSAGQNYGMALTSRGIPYIWGQSVNNATGFDTNLDLPIPICLPSQSSGNCSENDLRFTHVSASIQTSAIIGENGAIYMVGGNTYGELGRGFTSESSSEWAPVMNLQ